MVHKFKEFIDLHSLFIPSQHKVLLAVSGGRDSMCMLELFSSCKFNMGIAHCNFGLRGDESDEDESFVNEFATNRNIPYYSRRFKTSEYAERHGISIQMAARDLRYEWLEEVRKSNGYDYIATAHHKDDEIETFFINLIRGTGIAGLTGISTINNNIIRPLLFAARNEIEEFIGLNKIAYREDSSNAENKYLRNKIRNNLIPEIEKLNPAFKEEMNKTISGLKYVYQEFKQYVSEKREIITEQNDENIRMSINALKEFSYHDVVLYELLKEYGFNRDNINKINSVLDASPGKIFYSGKYKLLKDRDFIIIKPIDESKENISCQIHEKDREIEHPEKLSISIEEIDSVKIKKSNNYAFIDYDQLKFPLMIRKWEQGDYFYPLGMKGRKLLSDYFVDNKFSIFDKENTCLLCSGDDIVWIIGHRIDDRYKVSDYTRKVCVIELRQ